MSLARKGIVSKWHKYFKRENRKKFSTGVNSWDIQFALIRTDIKKYERNK